MAPSLHHFQRSHSSYSILPSFPPQLLFHSQTSLLVQLKISSLGLVLFRSIISLTHPTNRTFQPPGAPCKSLNYPFALLFHSTISANLLYLARSTIHKSHTVARWEVSLPVTMGEAIPSSSPRSRLERVILTRSRQYFRLLIETAWFDLQYSDQVSDAILDACLREDPLSKV
jgi:hypothetical protein